MASNRSTWISALTSVLSGITGVASAQAGQDWPVLEGHDSAELPMLWIRTPDQSVETIPLQYRLDDNVAVRIYRLDWSTAPAMSTAEAWIEKIVEAVMLSSALDAYVTLREYRASRSVLRDFPICCEEVEFKIVSHRNFGDL